MTSNEYDLNKLNKSLDDLMPDSATGIVKALFPKIKEKREQGVRLIDIYSALANAGLRMKKTTFNNLVAKLLKENRNKAPKIEKHSEPGVNKYTVEPTEEEPEIVLSDNKPISPNEAIINEIDSGVESLEFYKKAAKRKKLK